MSIAAHWWGYVLAAIALSHALGLDRTLFSLLQKRERRGGGSDGPAMGHDTPAGDNTAVCRQAGRDSCAVAAPFAWRERGRPASLRAAEKDWPSRWM
jgi:hypothetical protein